VFTLILAKHTKSFNLIDTLSVGVDRIQRNFEPLQRQVELWRKTQITDGTAKLGTTAELARDLRFNLRYSGDHASLCTRQKLTDQPAVPVM
jgi:hypothetical protein